MPVSVIRLVAYCHAYGGFGHYEPMVSMELFNGVYVGFIAVSLLFRAS